jgi:ABC-type sugar transport system substrate-binding protein
MKTLLLIVGILSLTVVGCTNSAQNNSSTTNTATNTSLETTVNSPSRKLQTIGVALGDLGNPFYNAVQKGAETEAKKIGGNIRVNAVSSGSNDQSGVGADLAARQARRKEFFIVGVDGSPDATKAMEDKDGVFAATAAQNPAGMAEKAVQIGYDIIQGKKPESSDILIPVKLVTRDNLSSYKGW